MALATAVLAALAVAVATTLVLALALDMRLEVTALALAMELESTVELLASVLLALATELESADELTVIAVLVAALSDDAEVPLEVLLEVLLPLPEELPLEVLLLLEDTEPLAACASASDMVSTKTMAGPATRVLSFCSRMLASMGWSSDVTKTATGPLIPLGTTQLFNGCDMENAAPPKSIWHAKLVVLVEPFKAAEAKDKTVPG